MGAQLRVYRQKIRSAKATKKITRAMELISASRIQKAQQRMAEAAPIPAPSPGQSPRSPPTRVLTTRCCLKRKTRSVRRW